MPYGPRSARTTPLPKGWPAIRRRVLKRDGYACVETISRDGTRCGQPATDVDHINDPTNHTNANLRSLCTAHHKVRSARQGGTAAAAKRISRRRPTGQHPGLIT